LLSALHKQGNVTVWLAINPNLSSLIQNMAKDHEFEDNIRLFDVTVPRGAFYKGCDIIFVPKGGVDSDISYLETMALGIPAVSCNPKHSDYAVGCELEILKTLSSESVRNKILTLASDKAMRTRLGEQQRQVFEAYLTPDQNLPKILDRL
jgi:glycosyltransferase involved in cell wall biosynthesis